MMLASCAQAAAGARQRVKTKTEIRRICRPRDVVPMTRASCENGDGPLMTPTRLELLRSGSLLATSLVRRHPFERVDDSFRQRARHGGGCFRVTGTQSGKIR